MPKGGSPLFPGAEPLAPRCRRNAPFKRHLEWGDGYLLACAKTKLLQPGESEILVFNVFGCDLASFGESIQSWVSAKGKYIVKFGASIEDIRGMGTYQLSKEFTQKVNDVLKPTKVSM